MNFLYGDKNLLRALEEVEFWKIQEKEHTVVIEQIIPNLEPHYLDQLYDFRALFTTSLEEAIKLIETVIRSKDNINPELTKEIMNFINYVINESQDFIDFLNEIIISSQAVVGNTIALVVIEHIIRESQYFIGIVQTILNSQN